ncbi:MAG: hypothetical protein WCG98_02320 [bacterium]
MFVLIPTPLVAWIIKVFSLVERNGVPSDHTKVLLCRASALCPHAMEAVIAPRTLLPIPHNTTE